ncbi:MAG: M23 family metallopeptidase [Oscillospiraceae bacterium]|nr:M23 family metallopeptidase [Oscillospiraceae bacterium]
MQNKFKGIRNFLKDKGYYIALLLCTAVVGVTGYSLLTRKNPVPNTDPTVKHDPGSWEQTITIAPPEDKPAVNIGEAPTSTTAPTETSRPFRLQKPVSGQILTEAAVDHLAYNPTTRDWRTHEGMDLAAELGQDVFAAAEGTVYSIYEDEQFGMTVVLRHWDGYSTHYSNLSEDVAVSVGQTLAAGEKLGTVGQSAPVERAAEPHVHFAVYLENSPVDPSTLLP